MSKAGRVVLMTGHNEEGSGGSKKIKIITKKIYSVRTGKLKGN